MIKNLSTAIAVMFTILSAGSLGLAKDTSDLRRMSVKGRVGYLPRHVPQAGYPLCRGRMRAEQLLHREAGQRFDNEQMRDRRVHRQRDALRVCFQLLQRRSQRFGIAADVRASPVGAELARARWPAG